MDGDLFIETGDIIDFPNFIRVMQRLHDQSTAFGSDGNGVFSGADGNPANRRLVGVL